MSDEIIRELERQVLATPDDIVPRQRLLAAYVRAGVCRSNLIGELAALGDEAAVQLLSPKQPTMESKSKRFYAACAFVSYRLAYSEWVAKTKLVTANEKQLGELLSFINQYALSFLEGRGTSQTFVYSGHEPGKLLYFNEIPIVISNRGWFDREAIHANPDMVSAGMMLHHVINSKDLMDSAKNCIAASCFVLRELNNDPSRGPVDLFFDATKPEIVHILLPQYPPPTTYRYLGF